MLKKNLKAYSLIELSIVLTIISVLVAGVMAISTAKIKQSRTQLTQERIKIIYNRLQHSMKVNRALPCPALTNKIKSADSDYGTAGNCTAVSGVYASGDYVWGAVPIKSLGLPAEYAEDGFGSKFFYFIDKRFTIGSDPSIPPDFTTTTFSTMLNNQLSASPSNLWSVKERVAGNLQVITDHAVLGIVSLGENKASAYNANSASRNPAASDVDELTNSSATTEFITSSASSDDFDDIVFYKTAAQLLGDFSELKDLIPCDNTDSDYIGSSTGDAWYNGVVYSKKHPECVGNTDLRHSKRCGADGTFTNLYTSNCESVGGDSCSLATGNIGVGSYYDGAAGNPKVMSNGELFTITCRSGFGREIVGANRYVNISDNTDLTCGTTLTDRSNHSPIALCNAGTIEIIHDCSACRDCTDSSGVYAIDSPDVQNGGGTQTLLNTGGCVARHDGSCGGNNKRYDAYRYTGSDLERNGVTTFDYQKQAARGCWGLSTSLYVTHDQPLTSINKTGSYLIHGTKQRWCQHQNHNADSSGFMSFQCLDGKFKMQSACCDSSKTCDNNVHDNYWGSTSCPSW